MSSSDQKSDHDSDSDYGDWGGDGDGWGGGNDEWGSFDAPKKKQATKVSIVCYLLRSVQFLELVKNAL